MRRWETSGPGGVGTRRRSLQAAGYTYAGLTLGQKQGDGIPKTKVAN